MMQHSQKTRNILQIILAIATIFLFIFWLNYTPAGILGKLQAIGYSVCHQIPTRSFSVGNYTLPLCSRCLGMYLGAFIGLSILFFTGRRYGLPSKPYLVIFGVFFLVWLTDGMNSFMSGLVGHPLLYPPNNTLRLITGFAMGLCLAITVFILFNYTIWQHADNISPFTCFFPMVGMVFTVIIFVFAILWQNKILLIVFSYLSIGMVVLILTVLYAVVCVLILQKENSFKYINEVVIYLNAGLFCALLQIACLDSVRYALTGTWLSAIK